MKTVISMNLGVAVAIAKLVLAPIQLAALKYLITNVAQLSFSMRLMQMKIFQLLHLSIQESLWKMEYVVKKNYQHVKKISHNMHNMLPFKVKPTSFVSKEIVLVEPHQVKICAAS